LRLRNKIALGEDVVMSEEVERYLTAILEIARAVLARNFVGAYAAGSLALDAFQVGRSRRRHCPVVS
jgi:hypothetical protein